MIKVRDQSKGRQAVKYIIYTHGNLLYLVDSDDKKIKDIVVVAPR